MRFLHHLMLSVTLAAALAAGFGASIAGRVNGPDGKPFMGAFVAAENTRNKITVTVLTDAKGGYHINHLPAATYSVQVSSVGYTSDPRNGVALTAAQNASVDFALREGTVRWSDLSTYQGTQLLPHTDRHDLSKAYYTEPFFRSCMRSCHSFQHRMASAARNEQGWTAAIKYMRDTIMEGDAAAGFSDEKVADYAQFLTAMFGPNAAKGPDMAAYKKLVRPVDPRALNIAYVEYDFQPDRGQGPWSAVEDRDGMMWIPYYGRGNQVVKLNPETAELTRFRLPFDKTAGIHSAVPSQDGTVWFTEFALGRLGQLDPKTGKIVEFPNPPDEQGRPNGNHTVRVDDSGRVWSSGGRAISLLNPATKEWRHFDLGGTYGNVTGHNGDEWFTSYRDGGPIGRVSKDGKLSKFQPPTNGWPQRLQVDENNIVWFSERAGNKIGRLDPETETFQEFNLPGPDPSPYAIGIDRNHMIWYSSHDQDTLNRLDPKTGQVIEYPYPHSEISMREFFMDSKGRMWYGSSVNNKVGYWYINE
jgi:virginiamycin B lyase